MAFRLKLTPSALLGLQLANLGSSQPPYEPMLYNKSIIYLSILPIHMSQCFMINLSSTYLSIHLSIQPPILYWLCSGECWPIQKVSHLSLFPLSLLSVLIQRLFIPECEQRQNPSFCFQPSDESKIPITSHLFGAQNLNGVITWIMWRPPQSDIQDPPIWPLYLTSHHSPHQLSTDSLTS